MKIFIALLLMVTAAVAQTTRPTDGTFSDVQSKIDASIDGDIVTIPAGSFTWTSGVSISGKGITLQGAGGGWCKGSSTTSNSIGTGSKAFTVQTGLGYVAGEAVIVRQKYSGSSNFMTGTVSSYSGTSLVVSVTSTGGSGTFSNWNFEQLGASRITYTGSGTGIDCTEDASDYIRVKNLHLIKTASGSHPIAMSGNGKPVIFTDSRMSMSGSGLGHGAQFNTVHAVISKVDCDTGFNWPLSGGFTGQDTSQFWSMPAITQTTWAQTTPSGMLDTTGENNIYIEDSHFHGGFSEGMDIDGGARLVLRYCVFDNIGLTSHGQDTGNYGLRWIEFYNNTFIFDDMGNRSAPLNYFFYMRGGTGLFTDNVIPDINSSAWGNKSEIKFTVQNINRSGGPYSCWTTYPAPRQVGLGRVTGSGITDPTWGYRGDSEPIYLWNNTGGGNYGSPTVETYSPDDCGNGLSSSTFIQSGRDFFTSTAKPSYTKYTYPHPLVDAESEIPPVTIDVQTLNVENLRIGP